MPDSALWEFMPQEEYAIWRAKPAYHPRTLLLNELQPGRYVLVGTACLVGPLFGMSSATWSEYSLRNEELGIDLP